MLDVSHVLPVQVVQLQSTEKTNLIVQQTSRFFLKIMSGVQVVDDHESLFRLGLCRGAMRHLQCPKSGKFILVNKTAIHLSLKNTPQMSKGGAIPGGMRNSAFVSKIIVGERM